MSNRPNFKKVYEIANEILVCANCIDEFPYNIKTLVKEQVDAKIMSYQKALEKYHVPIMDFGSESAHIVEFMGAYVIFYNSFEPKPRVRFSISHELGHMILCHKMNLKKADPLYGIQEVEANCLAAQLLMPEQLLRECAHREYALSVEYIVKSFGVSEEAARKRQKTLATTNYDWKSRSEKLYDDVILQKYAAFINHIAPIKFSNRYDLEGDLERQHGRDTWDYNNRGRWSN